MDWQTIIRHYGINHRRRNRRQLDWFSRQASLEEALITAAKAIDDRGKRYSHQTRIRLEPMKAARRRLLDAANEIRNCRSFHELWLLLNTLLKPVSGLGDLYVYDTSIRIGAFLNISPEKVYLHNGTLEGAKKSGLVTRHRAWLEIAELPKTLMNLPPDEVEDILCIYKDGVGNASCCAPKRSARC